MFGKSIFLPAIVALSCAFEAQADIKFIRPGETPPDRVESPDTGDFDLDTIYRGIDLLSRVQGRASRGMVEARLASDVAADDLDGVPGVTDADRTLAARIEIARNRAGMLSTWAGKDLDDNGVVTREELLVLGRAQADRARARRIPGTPDIDLTDEQRQTLVLDYVAQALARDIDGDDNITYEEAVSGLDEERVMTRLRTEGGRIKPIWDVNGDGTITEVEVRREADKLLDFIDANFDNVVEADEADRVRQAFLKARGRAGDRTGNRRVRCTLPDVPAGAEVFVIQGDAGTAVTNLAFDVPNDPVVRMTEVSVPEGARPVTLIASMRSPTVLRLTGPGAERVDTVIGVAAILALDGSEAKLANTPCHRGFLGIRVVEPGGVAAEFNQALGRKDVRALTDTRLGKVDLGTLTNDAETRLSQDALPIMQGDGQVIVDRFLSYDPGGYQNLDPTRIRSTVALEAREIPPLEIGLIVLAGQEKVGFVAPPPGFLSREVPDGVKRAVPESESTEGVVWEANRARFPLTVVVRHAIELPAGLTTERGVRLIVPDGVPKPRGAKPVRRN